MRFSPVRTAYPTGALIDPAAQRRAYAEATDEALADGFTGLRIAADATGLVRTPAQLDAFARHEHLIDRYLAARPFTAMCAYSRRELPASTIAELACLHPSSNVDIAPFRLCAPERDGDWASLSGELDMVSHELFPKALERADPAPVDGQLVLDASGLTFLDHHAVAALGEHARRRGATATIRTSLGVAGRIVEVLGLTDVRVDLIGHEPEERAA